MRRLSIRVRLTVLYGSLFFFAGALLLGVTYLLVKQAIYEPGKVGGVAFTGGKTIEAQPGTVPEKVQLSDGRTVSIDTFVKEQQNQARADLLNSLLTQGGLALRGVRRVAHRVRWPEGGRGPAAG